MLNASEYLTLMAPLRMSLCHAVGLASMDRLVPMGSAGSAEWYSFSRWDSFSLWAGMFPLALGFSVLAPPVVQRVQQLD